MLQMEPILKRGLREVEAMNIASHKLQAALIVIALVAIVAFMALVGTTAAGNPSLRGRPDLALLRAQASTSAAAAPTTNPPMVKYLQDSRAALHA
jgi:hypothetical protein